MFRIRTLAAQLLIGVIAILVVTVALGGFLYVRLLASALDEQYQQRAVGIANTVAQAPDVATALKRHDPTRHIQELAQRLMHSTGASYVVVTDTSGLRYSHPNPALIGQRLEEPVAVLDGRDHTGIDHGSLGRSANGKAPIFDASGGVIGQVSVGILESQVASRQRQGLYAILSCSALALLIGAVATWLFARRIKRITFGLEPAEIVSLLQEREAMLHGIREGVLGLDGDNRVTVVNAEAERLLRLQPGSVGRPVQELLPPGRLRELLLGAVPAEDGAVLTDEYLLVVNRMPAVLHGRGVGWVVTLRDRTELEALVRELRTVKGLTDALRAQEHEYTNRLHVISGLLELGESEDIAAYLVEISHTSMTRSEDLRARIAPTALASLILAKITVAAEQDIELEVTAETQVLGADHRDLITVVGNLVDNAIEALAGQPLPRRITLHIDDADGLRVVVKDNGPGLAEDDVDAVFVDGYSTKSDSRGTGRGMGLALVRRIVRRRNGEIHVSPGAGARFEVHLPVEAGAPQPRVDILQ